jgi:quinol monooxygenase YgiN
MIHVIAQIEIEPGKRAAFLVEFKQIIPRVLQEQGCMEYSPAVDAETDLERQHRNENQVTIIEKWETLDDLKNHLAAPHMLAYRERIKDMVKNAQLNILSPA